MALLAGFLFSLGTKRYHILWGCFCIAVAIWAGGFYVVTLTDDPDIARIWWKISFVGLILNPFLFYHFIAEFVGDAFYKRYTIAISAMMYSLGLILVGLNLTTNLFIDKMTLLYGQFYYDVPPGILHPYFTVLFLLLIVYSLSILVREYFNRKRDTPFRQQALYLFVAALVAYIGGAMNFLVAYGVEVPPATSFTVAFGSAFVAYSILRYRFFNVRVVVAQFLTFFIVTFALFRLALSITTLELLFNSAVLFVTTIVGIYLVGSVRKEVEQREEIQQLYKELEVKNVRLTELDKLKSQFLSIATHELRTPLTIVRNFIALMVDGSYGKIPPAALEAGQQVFDRVTDMAKSVDTYLNVSRIEQGKIKYDFAPGDVTELVRLAVSGMQANADKKGLVFSLTVARDAESLMANIDAPKITEVIINLIDNSIKYTPKGSVAVTVERVGRKGRVTIKDTGVGMSPETQKNLFKLFSPGEDSKKINPASTGVGLYVSKAHIEAHKGTLTAVSAGKGMGSTFVIEIPLAG